MTADLLRAYDDQLRTKAETLGALAVERSGPLWLVTFAGGVGFVSYRDLEGADPEELVQVALERFRKDEGIEEIEWKTRAHDVAPGLHEALTASGFEAQERESVMVGEAAALAFEVVLPEDVMLRRIRSEPDIRAMAEMQDEAFGNDISGRIVEDLLRRLARGDDVELWVAEADGKVVSAGRLEPVPDTEFAGIWGGATLPEWRGQGIYRALTAARARSALARGKRFVHSDSTEMSRPILERSGLVKVTETTPYLWNRVR
jgi:predicted GNAT family acetyltransferase